MNGKRILPWILSVALCAGPAFAHHAIGMIEISTPIWVKGTVVRYEPRNPHVLIYVEEKRADGHIRDWTIEGPIMPRLERMHLARDFIKPGDVIELCGFPFKKDVIAQHAALPAGTPALPALHAQLLVLPDGTKQPWGPYGKLDNCVRPNDSAQSWVDFVNTVEMAQEYWCKGMAYASVQSVAPKTLVDEVNRRVQHPCN